MAPAGILPAMDHIEPFRFRHKGGPIHLNAELMINVRPKIKATGKSTHGPRPLIFRALIGLGGCMKITAFNIRPQDDFNRLRIRQSLRSIFSRMTKKVQGYRVLACNHCHAHGQQNMFTLTGGNIILPTSAAIFRYPEVFEAIPVQGL